MTIEAKHKLGDKVWYAQNKAVETSVVCPDCFGQKALTVIKGDGSQVSIECAGCQRGYEPPRGYVSYYEHRTSVSYVEINGIEMDSDKTRYRLSSGHYGDEAEVFDNKEDAELKARELAERYNKEQLDEINRKEKHSRAWSWNAHYHREGIKKAKRDFAYHTAKLNVAKIKAKEEAK